MRRVSVAQAKAQLSTLLDAVEQGEAVEITRRGVLSAAEHDQAWQRLQVLRDGRFQVLELTSSDVEGAARLCLAEAPPLRAGDALHRALCQRQRCQLVSFDQALCAAAAHHRVACERLRAGTD